MLAINGVTYHQMKPTFSIQFNDHHFFSYFFLVFHIFDSFYICKNYSMGSTHNINKLMQCGHLIKIKKIKFEIRLRVELRF